MHSTQIVHALSLSATGTPDDTAPARSLDVPVVAHRVVPLNRARFGFITLQRRALRVAVPATV